VAPAIATFIDSLIELNISAIVEKINLFGNYLLEN